MTKPVLIDASAWYDDDALRLTVGLRRSALARGRREGTLRFSRRGGRVLMLGAWVQAWLSGADYNEALPHSDVSGPDESPGLSARANA